MATNVTLNDLVEAIAGAVIQAQDRVERHQTSLLKDYFDADGRPLSVRLRVPSLREDADEYSEEEIVAPLLAIVGTNRLAIKELEISTKVTLGDLSQLVTEEAAETAEQGAEKEKKEKEGDGAGKQEPGQDETFPAQDAVHKKAIRLDLGATAQDSKAASASLKLRIEAMEPTEGNARLMAELNKRILSYPKPNL